MSKYDDIINIDRPFSKHPKMSINDRSAQFSPFAALDGYDDSIKETGRFVEERIELDEESYTQLDYNIELIKKHIKEKPPISITYFVKDERKSGGMYISKHTTLNKIDNDNHLLITTDGNIDIDDIYKIELLK